MLLSLSFITILQSFAFGSSSMICSGDPSGELTVKSLDVVISEPASLYTTVEVASASRID